MGDKFDCNSIQLFYIFQKTTFIFTQTISCCFFKIKRGYLIVFVWYNPFSSVGIISP